MMPEVASPQVDISRATTISGWMSEIELQWLATQASKHKYIVEFGSFMGRSARAIADNMRPDGKLWCVDPWSPHYVINQTDYQKVSTEVMPYFYENLRDHIDSGRVIPVREFSHRFKLPHKVQMVFIDGDHLKESVIRDIKKGFDLLSTGGLLCGHDYDCPGWPDVREVVSDYISNFEVVDTIWHTVKS
jgi:predicted O-methyltransferase YrrM